MNDLIVKVGDRSVPSLEWMHPVLPTLCVVSAGVDPTTPRIIERGRHAVDMAVKLVK